MFSYQCRGGGEWVAERSHMTEIRCRRCLRCRVSLRKRSISSSVHPPPFHRPLPSRVSLLERRMKEKIVASLCPLCKHTNCFLTLNCSFHAGFHRCCNFSSTFRRKQNNFQVFFPPFKVSRFPTKLFSTPNQNAT